MAAHQAPVPGILQARILEWVAIDIPTPVHKQQIAPSTCNPWNVFIFQYPFTFHFHALEPPL